MMNEVPLMTATKLYKSVIQELGKPENKQHSVKQVKIRMYELI